MEQRVIRVGLYGLGGKDARLAELVLAYVRHRGHTYTVVRERDGAPIDAAVVDPSDAAALRLVQQLRAIHPELPVIALTDGAPAIERAHTLPPNELAARLVAVLQVALDASAPSAPRAADPAPVTDDLGNEVKPFSPPKIAVPKPPPPPDTPRDEQTRVPSAMAAAHALDETRVEVVDTHDFMPQPPASANMPRVLIADADAHSRRRLTETLDQLGFACVTARNAHGAWVRFEALRIDVVVLDADLPGGNAFALAHSMHRRRDRPRVILQTAQATSFGRLRAWLSGCDAYLEKPLAPAAIADAIKRFGARRTAERADALAANHALVVGLDLSVRDNAPLF